MPGFHFQKECLPLFCPIHQIYLEGVCKSVSTRWNAGIVNLQLTLTLKGNFPSSESLNQLSEYLKANSLHWLQPEKQCSRALWNDVIVYLEEGQSDSQSQKLVVRLRRKVQTSIGFNMDKLLSRIQSCVQGIWTLTLKSVKYKYRSQLHNYKFFIREERRNLMFDFYWNSSSTDHLPRQKYKLTFLSRGPRPISSSEMDNSLYINKLFFCNQVRMLNLLGTDVVLFFSMLKLRITYKEKYRFLVGSIQSDLRM